MSLRARYYDPRTGRFLSEDPIGFNSEDANLYRYAINNPLYFEDPTGNYARAVCYGVDFSGVLMATTPELINLSMEIEATQKSLNDIDYQLRNLRDQLESNKKCDKDHVKLRIADLNSARDKANSQVNHLNAKFGATVAAAIGGGGALSKLCKALP